MQLSSKPVKKRHQLCQFSDRLNIQRQFWNFQHFCIVLEKGCHTECRSRVVSGRTSEIIFIVFPSPIFPHKWRHSRWRHICGGSKKERFTEFLIHDPQSRTGVEHWFWEIFQDVPHFCLSLQRFFSHLRLMERNSCSCLETQDWEREGNSCSIKML